jgi:F-type H+-transporting ATPase subunit gamma
MAGGQERILRGRIRSIQATKKITRAMELIAASRIVKAQQRVHAAVPYSEQITDVVKDLAAAGGAIDSPLLKGRESSNRTCYVVVAADRGLCGGYNSGVLRAVEGEVKADVLAGHDYTLVAVGRKALGYLRFRGYKLASSFNGFSDNPLYEHAKAIGQDVMERYESGEVDRVELVYTRFISAGSQEVVLRPLVPLERELLAGGDAKPAGEASADYEFEPSPEAILETLLPRYVEARVYAALLNAAASEHAFRQRAMKSATDNAEELIKNLSRVMNRARQDSITTEIMEIVGGAEALGQGGDDDSHAIRAGEEEFGSPGLTTPPSSARSAGSFGSGGIAVAEALEIDDIEGVIEGIGRVIVQQLADMGVTMFRHIATWTPEDIARVDEALSFRGRILREDWVGQARAAHRAKYGEDI